MSAPGADDSRGDEEGPRSPEPGRAPGAVEIRGDDAGLRSRSVPRIDGGGTLSRDRGTPPRTEGGTLSRARATLCVDGGIAGGGNVSVTGAAGWTGAVASVSRAPDPLAAGADAGLVLVLAVLVLAVLVLVVLAPGELVPGAAG